MGHQEEGTRGRAVVSLSHVSLSFGDDVQALRDVSLTLREGERLCVLGANGSGKSTLASVVCGLLAPDAGTVELVGERVYGPGGADGAAYARARRSLGLVFQNPDDQIVTTVVADDVAFGPENLGFSPERIGEVVERELRRVALTRYAKADPTRLSGGQKQRVAIAGALAMEPRVLVLDEPGGLLDVRGRRSIMRVMARLREAGVTLVHVTHFMDEALAADRVVVLDHGRIALEGTPDEVFSHEGELRGLGLEVPSAMLLEDLLAARGLAVGRTTSDEELVRELVALLAKGGAAEGARGDRAAGRADAAAPSDAAGAREAGRDLALACEHLSFGYHDSSDRLALDDVSVAVPKGSTCAIVGQTGSGKSTLGRILSCLAAPDAGRVLVGGVDVSGRRERRAMRGHVGYVMQHPERQLFAETVADDVAFGPRNLGLSGSELEGRVEAALAAVGLSDKAGVSPFELSGGQQRLCAIAGVLAMRPTTLLLDEPTAGLDPRGRAELRRILARQHEAGVTIVEVTHSMEDAARCDQVVVLDDSRLDIAGTPAEVFSAEHAPALAACGLGLPWPLSMAIALGEAGVAGLGAPLTLEALADAIAGAGDRRGAGA